MEKRVLASKGILRSLSVALFLLVMSSLANSVPLTQLNRATGKYLTMSRGDGGQSCRHNVQSICHGDVVMHIIKTYTV